MSNGRAESMGGTLKGAAKDMVLGLGSDCDKAHTATLYEYRFRQMRISVSPFELLYGVAPRVAVADHSTQSTQIGLVNDDARSVRLVSAKATRDSRTFTTSKYVGETDIVIGCHVLFVV